MYVELSLQLLPESEQVTLIGNEIFPSKKRRKVNIFFSSDGSEKSRILFTVQLAF